MVWHWHRRAWAPLQAYFTYHHDQQCRTHFYSTPSSSLIPVQSPNTTSSLWSPTLILDFLTGTDIHFQKLLGPIAHYQSFPLATIVDDILSGDLLAYSNGSFNNNPVLACLARCLHPKTSHIRFCNAFPVDGHPALTSSHRADLSSLVAILYLLHRICTDHNILSGVP